MVGAKAGAKNGKGGRSQTPKGERVPAGHCRDWVKKGICARGDSCPYIHDDSMKGKPSRSSSVGKTKGGGKGKKTRSSSPAADKKPPCRQFLKGKCTRGTSAHIGIHLRVVSSKMAIAMLVKSVSSFTPIRPQSARGTRGKTRKRTKTNQKRGDRQFFRPIRGMGKTQVSWPIAQATESQSCRARASACAPSSRFHGSPCSGEKECQNTAICKACRHFAH